MNGISLSLPCHARIPHVHCLALIFKHVFQFVGKKLPLMVFGILSIVGGLLALPLPETRQRPLPETIEDVENYEDFCRRVTGHAQYKTQVDEEEEERETVLSDHTEKSDLLIDNNTEDNNSTCNSTEKIM